MQFQVRAVFVLHSTALTTKARTLRNFEICSLSRWCLTGVVAVLCSSMVLVLKTILLHDDQPMVESGLESLVRHTVYAYYCWKGHSDLY